MKYILLVTLLISNLIALNYGDGNRAYKAKDYKTAFSVWSKLAKEGNAGSQVAISRMYELGLGTAKNNKQVIHWLTKAAEQGDLEALVKLGNRYDKGIGVKENKILAYRLWSQAAKYGYTPVQEDLTTLCKKNSWACK